MPSPEHLHGLIGDLLLLIGGNDENLHPAPVAVDGAELAVSSHILCLVHGSSQAPRPVSEAVTDKVTDGWRILPDSGGEDDHIQTAHGGGVGTNILLDPVAEGPDRGVGLLISLCSGCHDVAKVSAPYVVKTKQPALLVEKVVHLLRAHMLVVHEEEDDRRIDISAPGAHDHTLQGGEPHAGIDTSSSVNGGDAAAIPQVAGDDLELCQRHLDKPGRLRRHELVARAVEAVPSDPMLFHHAIRKAVQVGMPGNGGMEGGIEHRNLGHSRKAGLTGLDALEVKGIVKRSEFETGFDDPLHLAVYDNGLIFLLATVDHPVTDSGDLPKALNDPVVAVGEMGGYDTDRLRGISNHHFATVAVPFPVPVVELRSREPDPLDQPAGQGRQRSHVEEGELYR